MSMKRSRTPGLVMRYPDLLRRTTHAATPNCWCEPGSGRGTYATRARATGRVLDALLAHLQPAERATLELALRLFTEAFAASELRLLLTPAEMDAGVFKGGWHVHLARRIRASEGSWAGKRVYVAVGEPIYRAYPAELREILSLATRTLEAGAQAPGPEPTA